VEAVGHEFVWRDVGANIAGTYGVDDEVSNHVPQVVLRGRHTLVSVQ
jgi:hypothetical protein